MPQPRILRFYLEDELRQSALGGRHNFIALVAGMAEAAGYRVEYRRNTPAERLKSATRRGYALFHMDGPVQDRAMIFRRVYHYPFWAIESHPERWTWAVARAGFPVHDVPRRAADRFYRFWQDRLFGDAAQSATRDGFVYVPLQGRLSEHRSFQSCAPLDMIRAVLSHDDRPIVAALHPNEVHTPDDLAALDSLAAQTGRLTIRTGGMKQLLATCDYVATQNSSVAFNGYFFGKPAVLFAGIDFHHIAAKVSDLGVGPAIRAAPALTPDYAGYVHWFWQRMSINAGRDDAADRIRAAFDRAGWPV